MASETITDKDVDHLMLLAAGYGQWCVGMPHEEMMDLLTRAQKHLREELAPKFGRDGANAIAEAFPAAVISARRALENSGTPRALN
jgi:phage portal protein BeeE